MVKQYPNGMTNEEYLEFIHSTVRVAGTYRGEPAVLNYNVTSRLVVIQDVQGSFVSGWQMSSSQLSTLIKTASLGGS